MPSLGEAPSGGARAFWLLLRFSKVTRCKSGTDISRYPNNGYTPNPSRQSHSHRRQASSHIVIDLHLMGLGRLSGRHTASASPQAQCNTDSCVDTYVYRMQASPPHLNEFTINMWELACLR